MNKSPPILNNIDKNVENNTLKNYSNKDFNPDKIRDTKNDNDEKLLKSNEMYKEEKEINKLLKECKDYEYIKKKISNFILIYQNDPHIEEQNKKLYKLLHNSIIEDIR